MCSFFLSPFRARTAEASARSAPSFYSSTRLQNIYFGGTRISIVPVTRIPNILSYIFPWFAKKIDLPSPPPPRFESKTIPRFACLALEDALCPSRFQSLHSAHDRPYCIGVRASAYINKQARVCIGEFLAAPSIVLQAREAKSGP